MSAAYPVSLAPEFSPVDDAFAYPDAFDKPYMAASLTHQPEYTLDDWVIPENYDRALSSNQGPSFASPDRSAQTGFFHPSIPSLDAWRTTITSQSPFGALPKLDSTFEFTDPAQTASFSSSSQISPKELSSPTPSLSDDKQPTVKAEPAMSPLAETLDTKPVKRSTSASSVDVEALSTKRIPRKRGRPRLNRSENDQADGGNPSNASSTAKARCTRRLPHNQVERKYREGINAGLERLRQAVPTLSQRDSNDLNAPPKPSKATVLASAIDYIKLIEADRERLQEEVERLRGVQSIRSSNSNLYGWNKTRSNSSSVISSGDE